MVCMTVWDFVIGVLFGIIVCCEFLHPNFALMFLLINLCLGLFFVVQNSQLRSVRAMYTGELAMSAVRRPSSQRAYIREVSKQTTILRLQGNFRSFTNHLHYLSHLCRLPFLWHDHLRRGNHPQSLGGSILGTALASIPCA